MGPDQQTRRHLLTTLGVGATALAGCVGTATQQTTTPEQTTTETAKPTWKAHKYITIFRNDDPAPWSDTSLLSAVTDIFIDRDVPLTQAIVPYDKSKDESIHSTNTCQYLNSLRDEHSDLFEFALHGYTHARETDFYWGSEFGGLPYKKQKEKIVKGTQELRKCIPEAPTTFVPPYNTYDGTTAQVLANTGYSVISGSYYFLEEHFGELGIWENNDVLHLPTNLAMEDSSTGEVRDFTEIKSEYEKNKRLYASNIIMLHYTQYANQKDQKVLKKIVDHAREDDTRFMTLNEFATRFQRGNIRRTENGWMVYE